MRGNHHPMLHADMYGKKHYESSKECLGADHDGESQSADVGSLGGIRSDGAAG